MNNTTTTTKSLTVTGKFTSKEWGTTFQLLAWWKADVMKNAKVLVVGAGALGNEVLKNLALLNVGYIAVVDFDHIEFSNLSRSILFRISDSDEKKQKGEVAVERVKEINPNIKTKFIFGDITTDVGLGIFRRVDVVIGCLDNRLARLYLNRICHKVGKVWIDGAIENLIGQVNVYKPGTSCYECGLSETEWMDINARLGCADVAKRNESQGRIPTTPISASIVGAIQAQEALKVIHGYDQKLMAKESFYYEGMNNFVLQLKSEPLKDDCFSHFEYIDIIESPLSTDTTIEEALNWLAFKFKDNEVLIHLDNEIVLEIVTRQSDQLYQIVQPKFRLSDSYLDKYRVISNEDIYFSKEIYTIDKSFDQAHLRLYDLGIPSLHIIRVVSRDETYLIELTGDINHFNFS